MTPMDRSDEGLGVAPGEDARPQGVAGGGATAAGVSFELGALARPLREQLSGQGVWYDPDDCARWQQRMEAIVTLRFGDIMTWSAAQKAYDRLSKQILRGVKASHPRPPAPREGGLPAEPPLNPPDRFNRGPHG